MLSLIEIYVGMMLLDQQVNRDTTFSMAAFEYDEEFISLQDKWLSLIHI